MGSTLLKGGTLVNEGKVFQADIRIIDQRISEISTQGLLAKLHETVIDAVGKYIIPRHD